ncbi:hypothetical protein HBH56_106170 [Parastagonospora nodorum]|nr:hypothetical protein HBH56_106170 [Parastagonospora nodorum]KAH3975697.1 hypothetical protein HBH52_128630 [Parastagonospora nodorum]KAH3978725.1 hypothetical protein HBH51_065560 [Parastagonospora nodorum]KAH3998976.1 hypothetical protein HBI10_122030 [Parastagonospora nodorum]KAH4049462.1 hypothetical protein HBH49_147030 [Parastagonospora nodorum]
MAALELAVVVNSDDNIVVLRPSSRLRLVVAEIPELQSDSRIHDQHARRPEEERGRAEDPVLTVRTFWVYPTRTFTGRVVEPCTRICEEGGRVEEVSEEGGGEERGGETGGRFADLVHVELGQARAEVEECGHPGKDLASGLSSGGGGRDGVVGDGAGVVWGRGEGADGFCEGGLREDGEDEGDVQHGLGRGHG